MAKKGTPLSPSRPNENSPAQSPSGPAGVVGGLLEFFSKKSKEAIYTAVFAALAALFWFGWDHAVRTTKDFVIQTVADEFKKPTNEQFGGGIKAHFEHMQDTQIGSVSSGKFWLTRSQPSYILSVYFPKDDKGKDYAGRLFYRLKNLTQQKVDVLLSTPEEQTPETLEFGTASFVDLGAYIKRPRKDPSGIGRYIKTEGTLRDVLELTFQLREPQSDNRPLNDPLVPTIAPQQPTSVLGVEVTYVSFVAPIIPRTYLERK